MNIIYTACIFCISRKLTTIMNSYRCKLKIFFKFVLYSHFSIHTILFKTKKMKTYIILTFSLLFFFNTYAQNTATEAGIDGDSITYVPSVGMSIKNNKTPLADRFHLSLQTGVSFFSNGKRSAFNNWIAPAITYDVTPKFNLSVGTIAMFGNPGYISNFSNESTTSLSQNTNKGHYFLYAQGAYLLNDRVTLRGTILKEIAPNQKNPQAIDFKSVGVDFKISDNFSISADYMVSKGYNGSLMRNYNGFNASPFPLNGGFNNRMW